MNQKFNYDRPSAYRQSSSKRVLRWRILLFFAFIQLLPVLAATYTPDNLPIPYLQDRTQYVSNPDGILSNEAVDSLNLWLGQMEASHGVQTVLAVVEHIEGDDAYEFCMKLGRKYGVGSKSQNSGLIILLATEERSYYILTGRGLEGALPDAICKRIENRLMVPAMRQGDWDEAMMNGVKAITAYVDGDDSLVGSSDFDAEEDTVAILIGMGFILLGFCFILFAIWYEHRQKTLCPNCHQHTMKRIHSNVTINRLLGIRTHHDTYRCTHCGFTKLRNWDENIHHGSGAAGAAMGSVLGGFSGRGGSGFTGGSFGGGSFGGGGAGGRF